MLLDQKFGFGKYCGLTLKEVYQGTQDISRDLVKSYVDFVLKNDDDILNKNTPLCKLMSFEVSENLIQIKSYKNKKVLKYNWTERIENVFRLRNNHLDRSYIDSLDQFNITQYSKDKKSIVIAACNPEYIAWCLVNLDNFSIDEDILEKLLSLEIYRFTGIKVSHNANDIYEYKSDIITSKSTFSQKVIDINREKNDIIAEREDQRDYENQQDDYNRRENNRDYFNAMTDGQLGSYDDFEGSSDDIDNWSGR
jgi:hypothetical protein